MKNDIMLAISSLVAASIIGGAYLYYEDTALKTSHYVVDSNKISASFDGFKIAQISDFHNVKSKALTKSLIKSIKKEKPDIIVITGDLVDRNRTDVDVSINLIKKLKSIAPIYYVAGNHESKSKEYPKLKECLKENGATILDDRKASIKKNKEEIVLLGVNDPSMIDENFVSDAKIMKDTLSKIKFNRDKFSILLSHRPELIDVYADAKVDLVFAGHAHGGQVRLPIIGGLFSPHQGILPKYTSGTFKKRATTMVVSRGIGNSTFPFRVNNRPELVITTLKKEKV